MSADGRTLKIDARVLPLAIIALAVVIRCLVPIDANIDWLVSNCRRFLDGARLYKDIVETNPPMAIFIYLPATVVERLTGLPAEGVFTAMLLAAGTASAWLFHRLVRDGSNVLLASVLFAVLVAPLSAFGEREHVALVLLLPLYGVAIRRAGGAAVAWPLIVLAGGLAGLAPMIKPYFALGVAAPYLFIAVKRRNPLSLLAPEALIAGTMLGAYALLVAHFIPAYAQEVVPLLVDLYQPMRLPLNEVLISFKPIMWALSAICLYLAIRRRLFDSVTGVLVAASAGFLLVMIVQGRNWPYHAYPAVALMLMAIPQAVVPALTSGDPKQRVPAIAAAIAALAHLSYFAGFGYGGGGVVAPIRAAVKHPTVMSISFDLTPGHPITTETHGTWVGTYSSRWITANANYLLQRTADPARKAKLKAWLAYDRTVANRDLMKRPDIVLVGLGPFNWPGWIDADPQTHSLMQDYAPLAKDTLTPAQRQRYEGIEAFVRKDLIAAPARP
ncbi:hypothetical protein [Asticcacaulis solisilvae]|uniref:hypothetical protein n=1 Tax=Asticcacaulis solisilvae TaxID=1217274 RepID=UPI003FD7B7AD